MRVYIYICVCVGLVLIDILVSQLSPPTKILGSTLLIPNRLASAQGSRSPCSQTWSAMKKGIDIFSKESNGLLEAKVISSFGMINGSL